MYQSCLVCGIVIPQTLRVLLADSVDYAGLFPPAALAMNEAVANYAEYRASSEAWALGRFIVPMTRLGEFERAASPYLKNNGSPWRLSVLAGSLLQDDVKDIAYFNLHHKHTALIDTIELKAAIPDDINRCTAIIPPTLTAFIEVPIDRDPELLIAAIAETRVKAKVRTGGVTADAFPSSSDLLRFIQHCIRFKVSFKATAGLHHPIRSMYNLTYSAASPKGKMYGYLNLLLATTLLLQGASPETAQELLEEEKAESFLFTESEVHWRDQRISLSVVAAMRQQTMISFGSCSFREPVDELKQLTP